MAPRAVLFAAGRGKRLRPLTDAVPKPALPLLDVPLGAFGLTTLADVAAPVVVNLSHRADEVRNALAPFAGRDAVEFFDEGPTPLGTGGTLAELADRLDARFVTLNADVLSDLDVAALLSAHARSGARATLAVRRVRAGADLVVSDARATEVVDRRVDPEHAGHLFTGAAVFERAVLGVLPKTRPIGLTEGLLAPLVARRQVAVFEPAGFWLDVGSPDRYVRACLAVLGRRSWRRLEPGRTGRREHAGSGWAWLGRAASAAPGTLGPGAVLLEGSRVAPGARVERSVVWRGERVPAGSTLRGALWVGGRALAPGDLRAGSGRSGS